MGGTTGKIFVNIFFTLFMLIMLPVPHRQRFLQCLSLPPILFANVASFCVLQLGECIHVHHAFRLHESSSTCHGSVLDELLVLVREWGFIAFEAASIVGASCFSFEPFVAPMMAKCHYWLQHWLDGHMVRLVQLHGLEEVEV